MVLETVRQTIQKYGLLKDGDKVLIACSGGADSTALLAVFLELRRERPMELSIGHFNHRLRPEAAEDEAFVRRMARSFGLPLFAASEDVGQVARSRGLNLEEAARALRYGFLEETARKIGAAKIATGHTMNDQAETFFLRLLRGSGLTGLGCIHPVVEEKIIRPLLFVERGEIEAFLRERGMSFRQDKSNRDRRFTRNRIRLELIPYLQKHFDPHIIRRISRLVALLQEEEHLLQSIAKEEAPHHITGDPGNPALSLDSVHSLPPALARRIIRCFLARTKGDLRSLTFEDVERVLNLEEGQSLSLRKGILLKRERGRVFWRKSPQKKVSYAYLWDGAERLVIPEAGCAVEALRIKHDPKRLDFDDHARALMDAAKVRFPLCVRSRQEGDRYRPLGAPGRKKVKEIMRARGIAPGEREKKPVFVSGEDIVWIQGLPVAENVKVDETTREVLVVSVSPLKP